MNSANDNGVKADRGRGDGRLLGVLVALLTWLPAASAGPFTPGNLVVVSVDTAVPVGRAAGVNLAEYTIAGSAVQTIAVPSSGGNPLTLASGSTTDGALSLSANGQYLTLAGYDAPGNSDPLKANNRVIARVDLGGTVNLTTKTSSYSNLAITSATTADGGRIWAGGAVDTGTTGGLQTTTFGATGAATPVASAQDTRAVKVVNGQLFGSTATAIYRTNTPLPTGGSGITNLVNTNLSNAAGFVFLDRSSAVAGVDTLYVADQSNGLVKFSFDGTTWTYRGTIAGGINAITGAVSGTSADLYITTVGGGILERFTDTAAFNSTVTGAYTTLASAPSGAAFRGVEFAPTVLPEPGSLLLCALALVGFAAGAARRHLAGTTVASTPVQGGS